MINLKIDAVYSAWGASINDCIRDTIKLCKKYNTGVELEHNNIVLWVDRNSKSDILLIEYQNYLNNKG